MLDEKARYCNICRRPAVLNHCPGGRERQGGCRQKGWVSDTECAAHGDKKCSNKDHIKMGSKLALVTDGDNKIWTVENPEKLADHQGHYVQVKGVANAEAASIRVETASLLPEPKQ
jgi:hypothetical protein